MNTKIATTDLTQRPPRSFHVRLGGFVILPRMLNKGRATLVKKNGEYNYNSPTDQHLVRFLGWLPEKATEKSLNGSWRTPRPCVHRGKSKLGQRISITVDRTATLKPSPGSLNPWGNTPPPAN